MNLWFLIYIAVLLLVSTIAVMNWKSRYQATRKYITLKNKHQQVLDKFKATNKKINSHNKQFKKTNDEVKKLHKNAVKMQQKVKVAAQLNQNLNSKNQNITQKLTRLYVAKQSEISKLETKLAVLKMQLDLPATSIDQIEVLKFTVDRLDNILKEENETTDQRLLKLENRLLELDPPVIFSSEDCEQFEQLLEDDLTQINGISSKIATQLKEYGVFTYHQLASLSEDQIGEVCELLGESGEQLITEKWIEQARKRSNRQH